MADLRPKPETRWGTLSVHGAEPRRKAYASVTTPVVHTATYAAALRRPVMTVPGPITSASSAGCHRLIRDGATLVTSAEDVLTTIAVTDVACEAAGTGPHDQEGF